MFKHAILWNTSRTPYYEAHQTRYLMKQAKHVILWSTPNMPFYEARQARQCFEARKGTLFHEAHQARKHPSTPARKACEHAKHVRHAKTRARKYVIQQTQKIALTIFTKGFQELFINIIIPYLENLLKKTPS